MVLRRCLIYGPHSQSAEIEPRALRDERWNISTENPAQIRDIGHKFFYDLKHPNTVVLLSGHIALFFSSMNGNISNTACWHVLVSDLMRHC